jgi:hypothetical protein
MQQACDASLFVQAASPALTTNHPGVTGGQAGLDLLEPSFFDHRTS